LGRSKAHLVGGGIGSLAAVAFMIRDGNLPGGNITMFEADRLMRGTRHICLSALAQRG
jgi:oleate hydratase